MQILQNMAVKAKFGGAFAWTVFKLFNFLVRERGRGGGGKSPQPPLYSLCELKYSLFRYMHIHDSKSS